MDIQISKVIVRIGPEKKTLFQIPELKIPTGQKILIKGASGKGKTTFLHLIAGLFLPDQGQITIGNTDITSLSDDQRSLFRRHHFAMVFQKLNLIDHLSALENIELSIRENDQISKAQEALKAVGLGGRDKDRSGVLSLGEQQRVAVARVLASDNPIVLADEPTSSLDDKNAEDVTKLLMNSCKDKTLIVVSHDHRMEKFFSRIMDFEEFTP